jgi:hypothetical protein
MNYNLNAREIHVVTHALRVAAESFKKDATESESAPRVKQQFERQHAEAIELADRIENNA